MNTSSRVGLEGVGRRERGGAAWSAFCFPTISTFTFTYHQTHSECFNSICKNTLTAYIHHGGEKLRKYGTTILVCYGRLLCAGPWRSRPSPQGSGALLEVRRCPEGMAWNVTGLRR